MPQFMITVTDDEGDEVQIALPGKMEVCPRCDGEGAHLTPFDRGTRLYLGGIRGSLP